MRTFRWLVLGLAVVGSGCKTAPPPPPTPQIDFRQELRPYGQWLVVPPYGKVWAPNPDLVGKAFTPYLTNGQWQCSAEGWRFVSGFPFGPLVFHYGRWVRVQSLDWLWIEGQEWGPPSLGGRRSVGPVVPNSPAPSQPQGCGQIVRTQLPERCESGIVAAKIRATTAKSAAEVDGG